MLTLKLLSSALMLDLTFIVLLRMAIHTQVEDARKAKSFFVKHVMARDIHFMRNVYGGSVLCGIVILLAISVCIIFQF